ncbi:MAG TPA: hypothetical protein VE093_37770 [Polyangiaceae bacterium]|jgi:hypothetical protein|nr:hypothetical protein [Polyangiaceae bacterium]
MSVHEVEEGRSIVELGGGLELDVLMVAGRAWAFWRWRGELLGEVTCFWREPLMGRSGKQGARETWKRRCFSWACW